MKPENVLDRFCIRRGYIHDRRLRLERPESGTIGKGLVWYSSCIFFYKDFFEGAESLKLLNGKNDLFAVLFVWVTV